MALKKLSLKKADIITSLTRSLSSAQEQNQRLVDSAPDIVASISLDGEILSLNKAFERITGWKTSQWLGRPFEGLLQTESRESVRKAFELVRNGESAPVCTVRIKTKNGQAYCELGVSPLYEKDQISGFFAGCRDITSRVEAELEVKKQKEFSENLINSSLEGIFAFDRDFRYTAWNPTMEKFMGLKRDEVIGKRVFDLFPYLEETGEATYYHQALQGKNNLLTDWPLWIASTHEQRFIETYFSPLRSEAGEVIGGLGIIRDMTEYKAAKEALIKTEHQYRVLIDAERDFSQNLIDSSVDGIFAFDKNLRYSVWNPAMERITGITRSEVLSKDVLQIFPQLQKTGDDSYFVAALSGNAVSLEEREIVNPQTGKSGYYETYFSPLRSSSGQIIGGLGIVRDVTEYKKAEEALKKSERQFRSLFEAATDVICTVALDGHFTSISPAWERMTGWTVKQGLKMNFLDLVHPDERSDVIKAMSSIVSGNVLPPVQTRLRRKDGQYRVIETNARALTEEGRVIGILGVSRDVTDRKQAEETIRTWAQIFRSVDIGIKMDDINGERIQMVNPGYARMHGYDSPTELINAPTLNQYPIFERKRLKGFNEELQKTGYLTYESVHKRKDGSLFPVFIETTIIKDEKGKPLYRAVIVRDITKPKELEEQVKKHTRELEMKVAERTAELERRLAKEALEKAEDEALLGSIGEGVIATDQDINIMFINSQTEALLGWQAEDVLGKKLFSVLEIHDQSHKSLPASQRPLKQVMKEGKKVTTGDYYFVRSDGKELPVSFTTTPVILDNQTIGAVIVFRDITKEKEIDRVKSEFVSLASHQLRTPLATINWYAESLLTKVPGVTDRQKRYLDQIYNASRRMARLVHDLLNVSRIELGTFGLDPEIIKLPDLVDDIIGEMRLQLKNRQLKIKSHYERGLPSLNTDRQLAHIVFQNLITNAIKYTPPGGTISVEIAYCKDKSDWPALEPLADSQFILCAVSDTGYGIPRDVRDKVFTKFFRADNVKGKDQDGTGLGLYIVKSLVGLLKGAIWFRCPARPINGKGRRRGTTFYVAIPIRGRKFLWRRE